MYVSNEENTDRNFSCFTLKIRFVRRRGVTLPETIILVIVIVLVLGAIIATSVWSSKLGTFSRGDINSHLLAQSWMEIMESMPRNYIADFSEAEKRMPNILSHDISMKVKMNPNPTHDMSKGSYGITLTLYPPGSKRPFKIDRVINSVSSSVVFENSAIITHIP